MRQNHMMVNLLLLLSVLTVQTWSAYVPATEHNANQLDAIQEQPNKGMYNSRHIQQYEETKPTAKDRRKNSDNNSDNDGVDGGDGGDGSDETIALRRWQLPHGSYDKNDDVAVVAGKAVHMPLSVLAVESAAPHQNSTLQNTFNHDTYISGDFDDDLNTKLDDEEEFETDSEDNEAESHTLQRKRRELSDWFIAPNTRWCGRGNTANGTYNHLGGASSADKCCRKHDHCPVYISAMSNRYQLFNYRPYTLSHCQCDRRFRTCLKMANDEAANTIGKLFFNMVQTQCFILRTERVCRHRDADGNCTNELVKQKAYLRNNKEF